MSSQFPFGIINRPAGIPFAARLFALALIATLVGLTAWHFQFQAQAQAQESLTITGRVINGTEGASPPADVPVLLLVSGADTNLIATDQTSTRADGSFEFQQVPAIADGSYAFSVDYAEVFYGASLSLDDLAVEVELAVYETTQDATIIKVTNHVMVIGEIDEKNKFIAAIEFVRLANASDRTLLPNLNQPVNNVGQISFLRFALPPLAEELDVGSDMPGGDIISIGSGFALTSPVVPGNHFVDFSFRFPYQGEDVSYRQSLPQGADVYRVMVPVRFSTVGVDTLQPVSAVEQAGDSYNAWEGRDFEPGGGFSLSLTGLPQPSLGARLEKSIVSGTFWKVAIPIAMGAVLAFLLVLGTLRPRFRANLHFGTFPGNNQGPVDREAAIRDIANLDERFHHGEVAETDYQAERESLVGRALGGALVSEVADEQAGQLGKEESTDD